MGSTSLAVRSAIDVAVAVWRAVPHLGATNWPRCHFPRLHGSLALTQFAKRWDIVAREQTRATIPSQQSRRSIGTPRQQRYLNTDHHSTQQKTISAQDALTRGTFGGSIPTDSIPKMKWSAMRDRETLSLHPGSRMHSRHIVQSRGRATCFDNSNNDPPRIM